MKTRWIILTIDDLLNLFKDALPEEDLPTDARPLKFMVNPAEHKRLAVLVESDQWKTAGQMLVDFQLRRFHAVGR